MQKQLCAERLNVKEVKKLLRTIGKFESEHTADFPDRVLDALKSTDSQSNFTMTRNGVHYSICFGGNLKEMRNLTMVEPELLSCYQ
jgi:hypothetical protein